MTYKINFLTQVIFQANYDTVESLNTEIDLGLKTFLEEKTGSQVIEEKLRNISLSVTNVSSKVNSRWIFKGQNYNIVIQGEFFQIINLKYTEYNDFHSFISVIFDYFKNSIYKPRFKRISLRYINNIRFDNGNPFNFDTLINKSLLSPSLEFKGEQLSRSMGTMMMKDAEEAITTIFNYGFFNSLFPNIISKREFILDYDSYRIIDENENIPDLLLKIRNRVNILFEKSILPDLRTIMNQ
jgi:uncharacterized protein (TIGR04255 family)